MFFTWPCLTVLDVNPKVERDIRVINSKLDTLIKVVKHMSKEFDDMAVEVSETNTVIDSAIVLLNELSQLIKDAGTDGPALAALTAELDAKSSALAAAVAANTPPVVDDGSEV